MVETIAKINNAINGVVWGIPMLILIIGTGIYLTVRTKFFQITHAGHVFSKTIGGVFKKSSNVKNSKEKATISQFQALCTALAATIGVGNIAGVAAAIAAGGPGAVFWMWLSAFFGMMTNYSENVLGIYYRRKNANGEWCGGAMYYLRDGLGSKKGCKTLGQILAVLFSIFCIMASFGIGNMSQVNTITSNITSVFKISALNKDLPVGANTTINLYSLIVGIFLMIIAGLVIVGGIKRIAQVTEKFVPFMAVVYIIGALIVFFKNITKIGEVFGAIFSFAFGFRAVGGAVIGLAVKNAATWGFKRGVFSNEAGLGSSVMVHSASNVVEPVKQGMWGIFEVFADTIVVCTLTAFAILSSGLIDLESGVMLTANEKTALVSEAFGSVFNFGGINIGGAFIAIAILLFAFSTVLGWSYYGTKAWEFLFGTKSTIIYKVVFVVFIVFGATMSLDLAWDISDTFNGLMALPNLIGVLTLSGTVIKITKNYVSRIFNNSKEKPMLSAFADVQKEQEAKLAKEAQ
jgi:AGCS family alanine or glycine:cation symporter